MAQPTIKTSFASGEWAPKLRSRVDIQKYHAGASLLRNFFVDYSGGGASTRAGTRFIAQANANGARLIPFQASSNLSYVLEFGQNYIRFYSNGAVILDALNNPYTITSPYNAADLFPNPLTGNPGLKFVQDVTSLIICHPNYQPQILTITSANNWTLAAINFGTTIPAPTGLAITTSLGAGTNNYAYVVTTVDVNNQESPPSAPAIISSLLNIAGNPGTLKLAWSAVPGAASYNVYKTQQTIGAAFPVQSGVQYGFVGNVTGLAFTETTPGVSPDFSQTPPISQNPFLGASVTALTIGTNALFTSVPSVTIAAPPSGIQATASCFLSANTATSNSGTVSSATSPVGQVASLSNGVTVKITAAAIAGPGQWTVTGVSVAHGGTVNSGNTPANPVAVTSITGGVTNVSLAVNLTWHIGGLLLVDGGSGYLTAPAVTFSAGTATATATIGAASLGNPGVVGFYQTRLVLAAQAQGLQTYQMSQPDNFFDFNTSNPIQDDDAISGTIVSEELNDIRSLVVVPTGIVALTGKGAWLINGGGGVSTSNPITPINQSASSQAFNGANDLQPIKINLDVLYGTNKGNYVRDLAYNIYANIYTGTDISVFSNHLFFGHYLVDWAWSEEPFKTLWAVRDDGILLSLGYVKEQELIGWAHHDTDGQFLSVCSVIEQVNGNTVDAVYAIVQRNVGGNYIQYIERMADRYLPYGYEDSWCVDCALQTAPQATLDGTLFITGDGSAVGNVVTLTDTTDSPFTITMATNNWIVRANGGIYRITARTSSSVVTATVVRVSPIIDPYTNVPYPVTQSWTIWQPVTTVSGLTQLAGKTVTGVADGAVVPPTVVSVGGSVTLASAATKITLGLAFTPQLQTLPLDLGEPTVQSKRKKLPAVALRVADTLGLQIGTSFANAVVMKDFQLGNIGSLSNVLVTDLVAGDGRTVIDQYWQEPGIISIQQNVPYPATILAVMPEVTVGDTK